MVFYSSDIFCFSMPRTPDNEMWKHFVVAEGQGGKKTATCRACKHFYSNANVHHCREHLKSCSKFLAYKRPCHENENEDEGVLSVEMTNGNNDSESSSVQNIQRLKKQKTIDKFVDVMSQGT